MPQKTNLNINPFFDDFDKNDNFYKVLFKPGFPVQARELTTLQSILQNQVESFGSHMFKEGSMVIPGGITFDQQYYSVKLNSEIKDWFEKELKLLNIKTRQTEGNFTLIETSEEEAEKISNHLMNDGIIIRRLNSYNLPNFLRISIGTKEEMDLTVESLKKFNV